MASFRVKKPVVSSSAEQVRPENVAKATSAISAANAANTSSVARAADNVSITGPSTSVPKELTKSAKPAALEKRGADAASQKLFKRLDPMYQSASGIFYHMVLIIDSSDSLPLVSLSEIANSLFIYLQFTLSHHPLVRIAFMTLQNTLCYLEFQFTSSISVFEEVLKEGFRPSGHAALATGLNQAYELLMDNRASSSLQRILYINFSNSTVDALSVFSVLEKIKQAQIRVDIVSLTSSFGLLDHIARETGGRHLIIDREIKGGLLNTLKKLELRLGSEVSHACREKKDMMKQAFTEDSKLASKGIPTVNPTHDNNNVAETKAGKRVDIDKFIMVGFPVHICDDAICFCHGRHGTGFYECPFCYSILCDITKCICCGLQLVVHLNLYRGALMHEPALQFTKVVTSRKPDPALGDDWYILQANSSGNTCTLCQMRYGTTTETVSYMHSCDKPFCKRCAELLAEAKVACPGCGGGKGESSR